MQWIESLARKAGLQRWSGMIVGMVLLVLSGHTWADATCTGGGQSYTIPMPASVSVPRDAAVGTPLSNWMYSPAVTNWFNCTVTASTATGDHLGSVSPAISGSYAESGVFHYVYKTNVPGVGVALGVRPYLGGCGWQVWHDVIDDQQDGCDSNGSITNGGQAEAILVTTGPITGGTTSSGIVFQETSSIGSKAQKTLVVSFSLTPTTVVALSCSTPDLTVTMGTYLASSFTGPGSSSKPVSFNVAVNNCPAGMTSIQYQFASASGVVDASQGVIALASGSTAAGIGVQLKTGSSNTALAYNQQYTLSSYNTNTGGSYTIPLKAAYYQTGTTVTPGRAKAIVTFSMTYQ